MTKVLVTGATGNVGAHVVRELRARGASVRAFVRDAALAEAKLGAVELAVGDFSDPASLRRALNGVDRVFLTSADGPDKVAQEAAVIDAAAEAWVERIVKLSTIHAKAGSPLPAFDWHGRIEAHLAGAGIPSVLLQSSFFMTNLLASADAVAHTGQLFAPAGDGVVAMIDPRDVAAAAAVALTAEGHDGHTYVLTGPDAVTFHQVAQAISAATGRAVAYVDVPDDAARANFTAAGMPDWLVGQFIGAFALARQGGYAEATDWVRGLTGRVPRSVAEFARDHAALFTPARESSVASAG